MKTHSNTMDRLNESIQNFNEACMRFSSSKFFLAPKELSKLLQVIAGSKELYELIKRCTEGFSFSSALKKAKIEKNGRKSISISDKPRSKQIAFVFYLLFSFDCKKIDMQKFIHTYFTGPTIIDEFGEFCKQMIEPFRVHVNAEIEGWVENPLQVIKPTSQDLASSNSREVDNIPDEPSSEVAPFKKKINHHFVDDDDTDSYLDDLQAQNLQAPLQEIINIAAKNVSLNPKEQEEILVICEAFEKSLEFGGLSTVKIMYIALKNTIKVSRLAKSLSGFLSQIEQYIIEYGIL